MKPNPIAFTAGLVLAVVLGLAERYLLWPQLLAPGRLDLNSPTMRLVYTLVGAIPALAGGYLAARLATTRPLLVGTLVGTALLVPMLLALPRVLEAYRQVPQSPIPLVLAIVLRPLAAAGGAYLTGRLAPARGT